MTGENYKFITILQCLLQMLYCAYNTGPENGPDHSQTIRQHYVFLVEKLDAKYSGLVGELYQAHVLSREERDIINSDIMMFTQNEKLLSMLSRKTTDQFDKFLDALDRTGQRHVHNRIIGLLGQLSCCLCFEELNSYRFSSCSSSYFCFCLGDRFQKA